jgi:hypothetical protein
VMPISRQTTSASSASWLSIWSLICLITHQMCHCVESCHPESLNMRCTSPNRRGCNLTTFRGARPSRSHSSASRRRNCLRKIPDRVIPHSDGPAHCVLYPQAMVNTLPSKKKDTLCIYYYSRRFLPLPFGLAAGQSAWFSSSSLWFCCSVNCAAPLNII